MPLRPAVPRHRPRARLDPARRDRARDPLVRARLHRRAAARLALRRLPLPAAGALGRGGADDDDAGRRPADLDDPRGDPRRAARVRAVLPAGLLPGEPRADPRGLAGGDVVPRRAPRGRGRGDRLRAEEPACRSCRSATRWRRRRRSGCSSGGWRTSSTPSSGGGRRRRPGRWCFPARRRRPARRTGSGPARGIRRSSTRRGSRGCCCSRCWRWRSGRGRCRRPGRVFGLMLVGYALARLFVERFRQADGQFVTAGQPARPRAAARGGMGADHGAAPVAADAGRGAGAAGAGGAAAAGVRARGLRYQGDRSKRTRGSCRPAGGAGPLLRSGASTSRRWRRRARAALQRRRGFRRRKEQGRKEDHAPRR